MLSSWHRNGIKIYKKANWLASYVPTSSAVYKHLPGQGFVLSSDSQLNNFSLGCRKKLPPDTHVIQMHVLAGTYTTICIQFISICVMQLIIFVSIWRVLRCWCSQGQTVVVGTIYLFIIYFPDCVCTTWHEGIVRLNLLLSAVHEAACLR